MNLLTVTLSGRQVQADNDQHRHQPGERHLVIGRDGEMRVETLADHEWWGMRPFGDRAVIIEDDNGWIVAASLGRVIEE